MKQNRVFENFILDEMQKKYIVEACDIQCQKNLRPNIKIEIKVSKISQMIFHYVDSDGEVDGQIWWLPVLEQYRIVFYKPPLCGIMA